MTGDEQSTPPVATAAPGPLGPTFEITVIAQDGDATVVGTDGQTQILTSKVRVPREIVKPGPRTHRFFVVDYDLSAGNGRPPAEVATADGEFIDAFARDIVPCDPALDDPRFHAQNVYAIAARTLSLFEHYLGRRVSWAFDGHQLHLVPNAQVEGNAYYDKQLQAVLFGYVHVEDRIVRTCLSHDVVAHEVTHAILDGLRPHYLDPGLPDQAAFHEGLADLVALLSVFELPEVLERQLATQGARHAADPSTKRLSAQAVTEEALRSSVLFAIAEELGRTEFHQRAVRYVEPLPPGGWWRTEYTEPHQRCRIIVAIVMNTLSEMWRRRLQPLLNKDDDGTWLDLARTVEEGSKAATYLLGMMIRALDVLPPVECEFEDVLDAVMVSDQIANPDDPLEFRELLRVSFAYFDITMPERPKSPQAALKSVYRNTNVRSLRCDRDEVYRFIWNNAAEIKVDLDYRLVVSRVRSAVRIAEDGLAVDEVWADYVQQLTITAAELPNIAAHEPGDVRRTLMKPDGMDPQQKVTLWGGGVLVLDQFGRPRWHKRKALAWDDEDIDRQQRRLQYLTDHQLLGGHDGTPVPYTHCALHGDVEWSAESW